MGNDNMKVINIRIISVNNAILNDIIMTTDNSDNRPCIVNDSE